MNTRAPLGPGEVINPFAHPSRPAEWRRPVAAIDPFGPPPGPWERGHYGFRFAYDRARSVFEADDAIGTVAESEGIDPALVAPELFAAAIGAAAHGFRNAVPPDEILAVARAAALVAWYDTLADLADRLRDAFRDDGTD